VVGAADPHCHILGFLDRSDPNICYRIYNSSPLQLILGYIVHELYVSSPKHSASLETILILTPMYHLLCSQISPVLGTYPTQLTLIILLEERALQFIGIIN
jgi:recombinational DNA repair protein RecR